jgi:hypothetical protein
MTHRDRFPGNASSTLKSRAISMLRSKAALESKCTASSYNPVRNISLFVWRTSRATASLESIVPPDFKGIIQCDGYQAYETFACSPARAGRIELAGCLAHMRRKFFEAQAEGADQQWVLAQVQAINVTAATSATVTGALTITNTNGTGTISVGGLPGSTSFALTAGLAITSGSGDDTLTLGRLTSTTASIDLKAGNNTVNTTGALTTGALTYGTGVAGMAMTSLPSTTISMQTPQPSTYGRVTMP